MTASSENCTEVPLASFGMNLIIYFYYFMFSYLWRNALHRGNGAVAVLEVIGSCRSAVEIFVLLLLDGVLRRVPTVLGGSLTFEAFLTSLSIGSLQTVSLAKPEFLLGALGPETKVPCFSLPYPWEFHGDCRGSSARARCRHAYKERGRRRAPHMATMRKPPKYLFSILFIYCIFMNFSIKNLFINLEGLVDGLIVSVLDAVLQNSLERQIVHIHGDVPSVFMIAA